MMTVNQSKSEYPQSKTSRLHRAGIAITILAFVLVGTTYAEDLRVFICNPTANFLPFYRWEKGKSEPVGHEVDLAKEIARKMGREIKFITYLAAKGYKEPRIGLLENKDVDLVVRSFTINEERQKKISFSQPYHFDRLGVAVHKDSEIEKVKDLDGKQIVAATYTTGYKWAKAELKNATFDTDLREYGEDLAAIKRSNDAAIVTDFSRCLYLLRENADLRIFPISDVKEEWGVGVNKGDKKLLQDVNSALDELKKSGVDQMLKAKWDIP